MRVRICYISAVVLTAALVGSQPCRAARLLVNPDGSGDYPTIQQAISAAATGDTVALADGIYRGDGNRDLDLSGRSLVILTLSDSPPDCIIDCESTAESPHRGFNFHDNATATVRGVTVRSGTPAVQCGAPQQWPPLITNSVLENCVFSQGLGWAAVAVEPYSKAVCRRCTFLDNAGTGYSTFLPPYELLIDDCVFSHNGGNGVSIYCMGNAQLPLIANSSFLGNAGAGIKVGLDQSGARFENCLVQGNGGDGIDVRATVAGFLTVAKCQILDNGGFGIGENREWLVLTLEGCSVARNARGGIVTQWTDCIFTDTQITDNYGRGIDVTWMNYGVLNFDNCRVSGNRGMGVHVAAGPSHRSPDSGLVLANSLICDNGSTAVQFTLSSQPEPCVVTSCTVANNGGAGFSVAGFDSMTINRSIVAGNGVSFETPLAPGYLVVGCTDIFGNTGGDWIGGLAGQRGLRGNFSASPCFCDPEQGDYQLSADSSCRPGHHPGCDALVGALGQGCPAQGCIGVPILVTEFAARAAREGVEISWRADGAIDATRLRLLGSGAGDEWQVPIRQGVAGVFTTIDARGPRVLRSAADARVVYTLQLATEGGWTVLGRQELSSRDLPGLALRITAVPNPFNPTTTLHFDLPAAGPVRLSLYDVGGRLLRTLVDGQYPAGNHQALWDGRDAMGRDLGSGAYFARLAAAGRLQTVRMSLVR